MVSAYLYQLRKTLGSLKKKANPFGQPRVVDKKTNLLVIFNYLLHNKKKDDHHRMVIFFMIRKYKN